MKRLFCKLSPIFIYLVLISTIGKAQDNRTQYPAVLKNSFYGVNLAYINYPFLSQHLEPGNTATSVEVPHTALRLVLFGKEFNKFLSAKITYMRPAGGVKFKNVNGTNRDYSSWITMGGLTVSAKGPVYKKISVSAEAGFGIINRNGFTVNNVQVLKNATYGTLWAGGSLQYQINKNWNLQLTGNWSPENKKERQPHTVFYSAGFNYFMRELPKEMVTGNANSGYRFPKHFLSAWVTNNVFGYETNKFVSTKVPIFWGGDVKIEKGFALNYQRNIFHTRKVFAIDVGVGAGYWKSRINGDEFYSVSVYPVLIFNVIRSKSADIFFEYSVAGPTFLNNTTVDGFNTGRKFTFQDFMGVGVVCGKKKNFIGGLKISHFSNGNIFPDNPGIMIPLTLKLGYVME